MISLKNVDFFFPLVSVCDHVLSTWVSLWDKESGRTLGVLRVQIVDIVGCRDLFHVMTTLKSTGSLTLGTFRTSGTQEPLGVNVTFGTAVPFLGTKYMEFEWFVP